MLNIIWPIFLIVSFIYAIFVGKLLEINNSIFASTEDAVNFIITLLGTMCLWNGIMQIAMKTSLMDKLTRVLRPIMKWLFPELTPEDTVYKEICVNIISNVMGLGNAATPAGLKAIKSMQKNNPQKDALSNSMGIFIVLNTASIQVIPTTVIAIRNSMRVYKSYRNDFSSVDCNNIIGAMCNNSWKSIM